MSTAKELGERIKDTIRRDGILRRDTEFAIDSLVRLVSLAPAEQAADLQPRPPNSEGKTLSTVRWLVELPNGMWLGAWDKEAFAAYLAASPQPPATHKGAMTEEQVFQLIEKAYCHYETTRYVEATAFRDAHYETKKETIFSESLLVRLVEEFHGIGIPKESA